jgi:hypothetical protein
VRQENIRPQGIVKLRGNMLEEDSYKQEIINNISRAKEGLFKINKRSDLYIFFFYFAFNHLKEKGIVSFLTSNSWLNIGFGFDFQEYIFKNTNICSIIDFDSRAFSSAEINTVITTLSNDRLKNIDESYCEFVKIKHPLSLKNCVLILKDLRNLIIENRPGKKEFTTPYFRLRLIKQKTIEPKTRWGNEFHLAPQIHFHLREKLGSKLIKLKEIAIITRGITTGLNKFFILERISDNDNFVTVRNGYGYKFQIESSYLRPFLISPKRMDYPELKKNKINHYLLDIPYDFDENGSSLAAKYIQYGRNMEIELTKGNKKGNLVKGAQNVPTLKHKKKYYLANLPQGSLGTRIFIQKIFSSKFKFYFSRSDTKIWANNTFYNINLKPKFKQYSDLIIASLLSSITYLSIELNGRRSFGMGALDTATFDIENIMIVDPCKIKRDRHHYILKNLNSLASRKFKEVSEEFQMKDRKMLDAIFLDYLEMSSKQQDLYESIERLVKQRISKSQTYKRK